ncbi:MAG: hypothetical protein QG639_201 [Patescibacteria group bacterium]|jgi:hypothetical protein|nr:hypothetical protein [Patescibacteria group bacterium]
MVTAEAPDKSNVNIAEIPSPPQESHNYPLCYPTLEALHQTIDNNKNQWKIGTLREVLTFLQEEYETSDLTLSTMVQFLIKEKLHISIESLESNSIKGGSINQVSEETVIFGRHQTSVDRKVVYRISPALGLPLYEDDWKIKKQ